MAHETRAGGKYTASHTSCTSASAKILDIANAQKDVYKISLGIIKTGVKGGEQRVKIVDEGASALLLTIRGGASIQEVRVYTSDMHATRLAIARGARDNNFHIGFK